jgi:hypothetical protein
VAFRAGKGRQLRAVEDAFAEGVVGVSGRCHRVLD